jgi:hypothetical protein
LYRILVPQHRAVQMGAYLLDGDTGVLIHWFV